MDRWKAEVVRVKEEKRREEKKKEYQNRESLRRKKIQVREKVAKSRNTVFFQWSVAPEGRKVGLLKRRVRSQLARWEMKNCTPLWREAHFEVKLHKTPGSRSTFGSWDVEKVYAVVAQSKFRLQNAQNTPKPLLEVEMSKKCTPLWREAHFEVNMLKTHKAPGVRTTFGRSDVVSRGRRKGLCTLSKVSKTWGFCSISIFDVVNFEKWGSVAELFRFWCCQLRKVRKSRRIVSFLMLSTSKSEEVSQNSFVFKLADRQTDR